MKRNFQSRLISTSTFCVIMSCAGMPMSFALQSSSLPQTGPVPLASPFASTPKGTGPFDSHSFIKKTPSSASSGKNQQTLKAALDALYSKDILKTLSLRNTLAQDSLDRDILDWSIAMSGIKGISSCDIQKITYKLSDWPGQNTMQRNFEEALADEVHLPPITIAAFKNRTPLTAKGMVVLGRALMIEGEIEKAHQLIAPWWQNAKLNTSEEQLILSTFGDILTTNDHLSRMRSMLYAYRINSAERVAKLAKAHSLYAGFAAVARNESNAKQKLTAVDKKWHNDPVFLFAKIQYLRRSGHYDAAADIMFKAPKDAKALTDPDVWWIERRVLSREMLDINKPKLAYQLAAAHAAESPTMAADAEFHAGWYALRFMNDPQTAMTHFNRILQLSSRPLSLSRGYYWIGRSAQAQGNSQAAKDAFQRAAHFGTTYYGQLAASKLGGVKLDIPYPKASVTDRENFAARQSVMAIKRLETIGYADRARLLYNELAHELKTPGEMALLAVMAEKNGDHYTSLRIGKNAVLRGMDVGSLSHPLGAIPEQANISASGKALAYSIARQESEFNPKAVSVAGAQGILQLLPATAKSVAAKHSIAWSPQKLISDAGYNATLGAHFLGEQLARFNGSYILTFIGYNAGPRRANEWIARYGDPRGQNIDDVVDWVERIPYTETRNYVMRVMENYQVYKSRLSGQSDIKTDLVSGRR
ncbi:lytic transglycosylase domain-containing protein [Bartonella tamiae]|uniref:Transglycosylase SLT domain-containing protein n=1 Tax=Bartonella tamiae Th239 TaxID=1094558 RepID=J1K0Q4_9HYPH|nr:lytic transglycosylase domain-containing protein [Bartonella tamiae]EJF90620.1 hypothetical protein ME5_01021 [Bartonella tamiae Th239]EJF94003.1 hypothetical protein MEG_00861 [Bartonella tamiae Th307]